MIDNKILTQCFNDVLVFSNTSQLRELPHFDPASFDLGVHALATALAFRFGYPLPDFPYLSTETVDN